MVYLKTALAAQRLNYNNSVSSHYVGSLPILWIFLFGVPVRSYFIISCENLGPTLRRYSLLLHPITKILVQLHSVSKTQFQRPNFIQHNYANQNKVTSQNTMLRVQYVTGILLSLLSRKLLKRVWIAIDTHWVFNK